MNGLVEVAIVAGEGVHEGIEKEGLERRGRREEAAYSLDHTEEISP